MSLADFELVKIRRKLKQAEVISGDIELVEWANDHSI
jgi:hypothetical protein